MLNTYKSVITSYLSNYKGIPKTAGGGIVLSFISTLLTGTFYFLSYYFVNVLHFNVKTASFFVSFYGLGAIIGGLLGGKLSDKYSPKAISALSILLQGLSFLLFIKFKASRLIIFNICMLGMVTYSFITSNYLSVLEECISEKQKLQAISVLSVISNLGLGFAAIFIGYFDNLDFKYLFLFCGLILFAIGLGRLFFAKNFKQKKDDDVKVLNNNFKSADKNNYINIFLILFALLLIGIIVSQMSSTYSIFINVNFPEYGLSGFSIIFLINTSLIIILQAPLVNLLSDKDKMLYIGVGGLLVALGMALLGFADAFYIVVIACIVYTFGEMIFFSLSQLVCYENSPSDKKGLWTGIYRMVFASSRIIGPALGGTIYLHYGSTMLWFLCFGMGIACFVTCLVVRMVGMLHVAHHLSIPPSTTGSI